MMINNVNLKKVDIGLTNDTNHRNINLLSSSSKMCTSENHNTSLQYSLSQTTAPILNRYSTLSTILGADNTREILNSKNAISSQVENPMDDRVKEQQQQEHVHVRLQNNGWNYHNFCRFYKKHTNNNNYINYNNNNNKSIKEFNNQKKCIKVPEERVIKGSSYKDVERQQVLDLMKCTINNNRSNDAGTPLKRTEDQESAFRLIEDVHNYAKLNQQAYSESSSTETSRSSPNAADDEEDKLDNNNDNVVDDDDDNSIGIPLRYLSQSKYLSKNLIAKREQRKNVINKFSNKYHDEEDVHIDVETVPKEEEIIITLNKNDHVLVDQAYQSPPDHHARRPMNAFLIFCKRHRAIVKDRYKTLENRAITKILGDWWASLDPNDKQCFTDLAQQNKDAFFSANPNFKWYKLPAPPLRTLQTRPNPNESLTMDLLLNKQNDNNSDNYFKFADETQMGDLNALLMYDKSNKKKLAANKVNGALQQALGETKNFLNLHMLKNRRNITGKRVSTNSDTNSLSSSSSGEDFIPKKRSRSCKGKIYQELIQSGQITTAIVKKNKDTLPKSTQQEKHNFTTMMDLNNIYEKDGMKSTSTKTASGTHINFKRNNNNREMTNYIERSGIFDLEEKIKELPSLNLDEYLQRKRNIKKKRKVNVNKKRNIKNVALKSNHINLGKESDNIETNGIILRTNKRQERNNSSSKTVVAVGSQKRKARKESITRRDVSIIENELTAVLPMNNTRNYFNESITCDTKINSVPAVSNSPLHFAGNDNNVLIINNNNNNTVEIMQCEVNDFNKTTTISPTSDLLILAEVAVNRTQCSEK